MKKYIAKQILFLVIYAIVSYGFLYIIIYDEVLGNLSEYKYTNLTSMKFNDCALVDTNKVEITGNDPYMVIYNLNTPIRNIQINLSQEKKYINKLSVYYNTGKHFNEMKKKSINIKQNESNIILGKNKNINSIRLDFEDINFEEEGNITIDIKYLWINPKTNIKFPIDLWIYNIVFIYLLKILFNKMKIKIFYLGIITIFITIYCYNFIILKYQILALNFSIVFVSLIVFIGFFYSEEN